ncbi:MAG: hypothetical protein K8F30_04980, partial [Taibaiella sp.]|nr:hypothetical protein [Taibaiella sp.]
MEENQIVNQTEGLTEQQAGAHDDFDWSVDKRNVSAYAKDKQAEMEKLYDSTFKNITESELLTGQVVGKTKTDVIIN